MNNSTNNDTINMIYVTDGISSIFGHKNKCGIRPFYIDNGTFNQLIHDPHNDACIALSFEVNTKITIHVVSGCIYSTKDFLYQNTIYKSNDFHDTLLSNTGNIGVIDSFSLPLIEMYKQTCSNYKMNKLMLDCMKNKLKIKD